MSGILALVRGRKFGSLLAGLSFLVASVSGVLSFASAYTERLAAVHTVAGFAFVVAAAVHVAHNAATWLRYARGRRAPWPSLPFVVTAAITSALLAGAFARVRPLSVLLAWGASLRNREAPVKTSYQTIKLDLSGDGPVITLDVKAGPWFSFVEPTYGFHITPQIAAWTEGEDGGYLETLYVTRDEGRDGYDEGDERHTLSPRPAALPVWRHRIGVRPGATPLLVRHDAVPDVVSSASPTDNVYLVARAHTRRRGFFLLVEINSSFDYNAFYHPHAFPDEPGYSDGGNPAQPSVVYRAWIEPLASRFAILTPVGHGHHAGADGRIDPDLSHLTTALQIVDRIVVEVRDGR